MMVVEVGQGLRELITRRTGLMSRDTDAPHFEKVITARMRQLRLTAAEHYHDVLLRDLAEWHELIPLLTTGETYFLRDQGQCAVLENFVLPALIERNQGSRSLRIWSAGCSTGEEAYSLAILVDKLLPTRADWEILIIGTDINVRALEQARRGTYGQWSFRTLKPEVRARYFRERGGGWEIDERIRAMVTFRHANLVADHFPDRTTLLHDMDLILCRNVFIYFEPEAVADVVRKFGATLAEHGYLLTGHAELHGQSLGPLRLRLFPEAVVYQHAPVAPSSPVCEAPPPVFLPGPGLAARVRPNSIWPTPAAGPVRFGPQATVAALSVAPAPRPAMKVPEGDARALLSEADSLFEKADYRAVIARVDRAITINPDNVDALLLAARAHANLGELARARYWCEQVMELDQLNVEACYLLAHLAEERGDQEEVKRRLNQVLYLCPSFVAAYLELGSLHDAEGDSVRANTLRSIALRLLGGMRAEDPVPHCRGLTAGQLRMTLAELIAEPDVREPACSVG